MTGERRFGGALPAMDPYSGIFGPTIIFKHSKCVNAGQESNAQIGGRKGRNKLQIISCGYFYAPGWIFYASGDY
jgi:hypothetical protein